MEEGLQIERGHREGNDIDGMGGNPFGEESRQGRQQEDGQQIIIPVAFLEDIAVGVIDAEIEDDDQGEGDQDIPEPHQDPGAVIAVHLVVFLFVRVEDLGDFRRHDLPFRNDFLVGVDIPRGRRNVIRRFGVGEFGHRPVEFQVRNDQPVDPGFVKQGIHIDGRVGPGDFRHQFVLGVRDLVDLRNRELLRPLPALDEDDLPGKGG